MKVDSFLPSSKESSEAKKVSFKMKISWKFWVTILLLFATILLLLVLYLMYNREVLDSINSKTEKFLSHVEKLIEAEHEKLAEASWIYKLNSTGENWESLQTQSSLFYSLIQEIQQNITVDFLPLLPTFSAGSSSITEKQKIVRRKFDIILKHFPESKLSSNKLRQFNELVRDSHQIWKNELTSMKHTIHTTKLNSNWSSQIYFEYEKQLAHTYWIQFHDDMSSQLSSFIPPYVQLLNEQVLLNKFSNFKDYLLATEYELRADETKTTNDGEDDVADSGDDDDDDNLIILVKTKTASTKEFINQMYDLWYNLKPLYDELHAYVRAEIESVYNLSATASPSPFPDGQQEEQEPDESLSTTSNMNPRTIPEQFFGFSGSGNKEGWTNVYKLTKPYSGRVDANIDEELKTKKYNTVTLAKLVEDYLVSLDFPAMHPSFWEESLFGNDNPELSRGGDENDGLAGVSNCCNSSAVYESNRVEKLKIAICGYKNGVLDEELFKTIIRLMIRVKFQMVEREQSFWFRKTSTKALKRGFEEAIVLAMTRPTQLAKFALTDDSYTDDSPAYLNYLYKEALQDLPSMIQALATFRWSLEFFNAGMNGGSSVSLENFNRRWWMLRQNLIGLKPPEPRITSNTNFVDYTSILTTNSNPLEEYVTIVLKYQIYKALCIWSNESDGSPEDLQTCDIARPKPSLSSSETDSDDGDGKSALISTLEHGSSKSWIEILKLITNQTQLDTDPMLDYFEILHEYLEDRNERRGLQIGWPRLLRSDPLEMLQQLSQ